MKQYAQMTAEELKSTYTVVMEQFEKCKAQNLKLDMSRGKPAKNQLDCMRGMLTCVAEDDPCLDGKVDVLNYGELAGIPSARAYWADVLGCKPEQIFVGGNSSLNLMFDLIARAY